MDGKYHVISLECLIKRTLNFFKNSELQLHFHLCTIFAFNQIHNNNSLVQSLE